MDADRLSGTEKKIEGRAEEGLGRVFGDAGTIGQGKIKQAVGAAQDAYGQAKDAASGAIGSTEGAIRD